MKKFLFLTVAALMMFEAAWPQATVKTVQGKEAHELLVDLRDASKAPNSMGLLYVDNSDEGQFDGFTKRFLPHNEQLEAVGWTINAIYQRNENAWGGFLTSVGGIIAKKPQDMSYKEFLETAATEMVAFHNDAETGRFQLVLSTFDTWVSYCVDKDICVRTTEYFTKRVFTGTSDLNLREESIGFEDINTIKIGMCPLVTESYAHEGLSKAIAESNANFQASDFKVEAAKAVRMDLDCTRWSYLIPVELDGTSASYDLLSAKISEVRTLLLQATFYASNSSKWGNMSDSEISGIVSAIERNTD